MYAFLERKTSQRTSKGIKTQFQRCGLDRALPVIALTLCSRQNEGELQRFLGEITWFPTAWFSDAIEWQEIDEHSVQATLHVPGVTGSVVLHVNEQGQVCLVTAQRYMGNQGHLRP